MITLPSFFRPSHNGLLLAASIAVNVLALALPLMTMQIYDRVMPNHATDTLFILSCGVIIAAAAEMVLKICRSMIVGISAASFEHEAASSALERVLQADPRDYDDIPPSVLMQDIGAATKLKDYYGGQMAATLLVDMPFVLIFMVLAFYLTGSLAYVTIGVMAAVILIMWRQGSQLRGLMMARATQDDALYHYIAQSLQAVHAVKSMCLEAVTVKNFAELQKPSGVLTYKIARLQGKAGITGYLSSQLMTVAIVCIGAPMAINGNITIGMLAACIMLSGQVLQPVLRSLGLWLRLQEIMLAKKRLSRLLAQPVRDLYASETHDEPVTRYELKLDNVSFAYKHHKPVLHNLSLSLAPGEIVAVLGGSGAGKTTFLELLAGLYTPDTGRITIGGLEPSRMPPAQHGRTIGYLPTKGIILRGSIIDNMTGFDARLEPAAHELATMLGIEQSVALLPAGYDTPLDGLATDLVPPGFKQRVAIVRALLHHPRIILYDNADQGLDRTSYNAVFGLLARLKRKATIIIVSDDRNILSLADKVIELHGGTLSAVAEPAPWLATRSVESKRIPTHLAQMRDMPA